MITILGPTATGKTDLAAFTAYKLNGEIISADSRQVYRGMNIGTGKDYESFVVNESRITCHLIDICEPGEEYNIFRFRKDFIKAYLDITDREKLPVLCGGTGLYIESVLRNYRLDDVPENPGLRSELATKSMDELISLLKGFRRPHNITDTTNRERLTKAIEIQHYYKLQARRDMDMELTSLNFGIFFEREALRQRIRKRLDERLREGMADEVKMLLDRGVSITKLLNYGLEYKYMALYISGELSFHEMYDRLFYGICQFSKRQMTWFRKMEREGIVIHWINGELPLEGKFDVVRSLMK